jgi:alkylation response protein AidB-like acyl-CoA dehydrogenase
VSPRNQRLAPLAATHVKNSPAGRRALGWWLIGTSRTMLALARQHALDRVQFGRSVASFQAVRHRLAETLVAIEGAEATLSAATNDFTSLLAKAAAGQAALTAAKHCQQVPLGAQYDYRDIVVLGGACPCSVEFV